MSPHYISFLRRRKAYNTKLNKASLKKKGHTTFIMGLLKELETCVGISVLVEMALWEKETDRAKLQKKTNQQCGPYQPEGESFQWANLIPPACVLQASIIEKEKT